MKKNLSLSQVGKGGIILYQNKVEVRLEQDTLWVTQAQIAELFGTQRPAITKHLLNIFQSGELREKSVCSILEHTAADGKKYKTGFYNLDAVLSIGYRVNSRRATQFRIWATSILKKHLVEGYTLNESRLKKVESKYRDLQKAVNLLGNMTALENLPSEARSLAQVISQYSRALDLLDDYDHERLSIPKGTKKEKFRLTYEKARKIIETMKKQFKDSPLMGREKDKSFKSSLGAIHQTFGGKDVYPTVEEKAAHLLYFVTKNHSFVDGNKRIAAALFICFLQGNNLLIKKDQSRRIEDGALVALALMIAASKPSEKEMMIKVILNLIV